MRALLRLAAIAVAGATLYFAGLENGEVIAHPDPVGAVAVALGVFAALVVMAMALIGDGRGDAASPFAPRLAWRLRVIWAFVSIMAIVGLAWLIAAPRDRVGDPTPYHNDAIALDDCAARLLLRGRDPYTDLDVFGCYAVVGIGPDRTTPVRRGSFASLPAYPNDDQLDAAWSARDREAFVSRPSYPALSFVALVPFVRFGVDPNLVYLACLLASMALVVARARRGLRPFVLTALLGAACLSAFTVGGSADLLYALPLVAAWLWRERRWSALAMGAAVATKQLAWFFAPYYVIGVVAAFGWREGWRRVAIASGVFALVNAPFIVAQPSAWLAGVLTPVGEPLFARGAGLVFAAVNGAIPMPPPLAFGALEGLAILASLALAWRERHRSPELGAALALAPLWFGWRSLYSYFFLIPLFCLAAVARMPLGDLAPVAAKRGGALTLFALPRKTS